MTNAAMDVVDDDDGACRCGMPHLTRFNTPSCVAHRRDGSACRRSRCAGLTVCQMHGGSSPASKAKSRKVRTASFIEGKVGRLLRECDMPDTHPLDGLLEVVRHAGGMFRLLAGLVGELEIDPNATVTGWIEDPITGAQIPLVQSKSLRGHNHLGEEVPNVLIQLYGTWLDRYAKALKLCADANIDERIVRNAEATTNALWTAMGRALNAAELTQAQQTELRKALARELRQISGMGAIDTPSQEVPLEEDEGG